MAEMFLRKFNRELQCDLVRMCRHLKELKLLSVIGICSFMLIVKLLMMPQYGNHQYPPGGKMYKEAVYVYMQS